MFSCSVVDSLLPCVGDIKLFKNGEKLVFCNLGTSLLFSYIAQLPSCILFYDRDEMLSTSWTVAATTDPIYRHYTDAYSRSPTTGYSYDLLLKDSALGGNDSRSTPDHCPSTIVQGS